MDLDEIALGEFQVNDEEEKEEEIGWMRRDGDRLG